MACMTNVITDMEWIIIHNFPIKKALGNTLILMEVGGQVGTCRVLSKACLKYLHQEINNYLSGFGICKEFNTFINRIAQSTLSIRAIIPPFQVAKNSF
jgi:hypothetical protein